MKNKFFLATLLVFAFFLGATNSANAQNDPPVYVVVDFMKVPQGAGDQYVQIEKLWKRIHESRIRNGHLTQWSLHQVASPYGSETEHNYITLNVYTGNDQLAGHYDEPMMSDEIEALFNDEEKALLQKTGEARKLVREEVFRFRNGTFDENPSPAQVAVVNFMKFKEGVSGPDYGKVENEIWKPVHQARIKEGKARGWGVYSLELPYGTSVPYNATTVDFYDSMSQYLAPAGMEATLEAVHPDKDPDDLFEKTSSVRDLLLAEVWMLLDITKPAKELAAAAKE